MTTLSTAVKPTTIPTAALSAGVPEAAGEHVLIRRLGVCVLLLAATLLAHGWSLEDGLFLDDHHHLRHLRSIGWTPRELLEAATIEPQRFIDMWWQDQPARWQYSRPFSILLMKLVYAVTGDSVRAQHAVSLLMHCAAACLVHQLCLLLTRSGVWSIAGALLFVVYSHSVFAVGWLAAQNTILQTLLTLGALLCYLRASALDIGPSAAVQSDSSLFFSRADSARPLRGGWFAAALFLWLLALLSRENAVILPILLAAFDLAFGGRRQLRARLVPHAILFFLAAAFLAWRLVLYHHPMPDFYARQPGAEGYAAWWIAKLLHYLCAAVWLSPMVIGPSGRFRPFEESPGDYWFAAAILLVMGAGYLVACRRARGWWIWPLWLLLAVLPVVHIMPTPHQGYFCAVPFAVAMILGPGLARIIKPPNAARCSRWIAAWFLFATCLYIPIYRTLWEGMIAAERYTMAGMESQAPPDQDSDLFFLNLPFVNIYVQTCLRDAWRAADGDFRCHVLTYSPETIRVDKPCYVEQLDDYRFTIQTEGEGYFSGVLGRFLIEALRGGRRLRAGEIVERPLFTASVISANERGVQKLEFAFREKLSSPRFRFYLTTMDHPAALLRFRDLSDSAEASAIPPTSLDGGSILEAAERLAAGDFGVAEPLWAAAMSDDVSSRDLARSSLQRTLRAVARALGSPLQKVLDSPSVPDRDWPRLRRWWHENVDQSLLAALTERAAELEAIRARRDSIYTVQTVAGRIIHSDLYMTGPPFRGPR